MILTLHDLMTSRTRSECVAALAPTVVGCVAAATEEGVNPVADVSCLVGAVNLAVNLVSPTVLSFAHLTHNNASQPASCDSCLEQFGIDEPSAISSALGALESLF